jgi:hypothetical protein
MKKYLSKAILGFFLSLSIVFCFSMAYAGYTYTNLNDMSLASSTDAWNINPTTAYSNQVISSSATWFGSTNPDSDFGSNRMFGSWGSGDGSNHTIFAETASPETKVVTWSTSQAITLYGVNLFASLDSNSGNPVRAISNFSLYYSPDGGTSWVAIIDGFNTGVTAGGNYGAYSLYITDLAQGMAVNFAFDPVTAKYFKAVFGEYDAYGARVNELDAITTPVPIPAAVWLLGSGLVGLLGLRRLKK